MLVNSNNVNTSKLDDLFTQSEVTFEQIAEIVDEDNYQVTLTVLDAIATTEQEKDAIRRIAKKFQFDLNNIQ